MEINTRLLPNFLFADKIQPFSPRYSFPSVSPQSLTNLSSTSPRPNESYEVSNWQACSKYYWRNMFLFNKIKIIFTMYQTVNIYFFTALVLIMICKNGNWLCFQRPSIKTRIVRGLKSKYLHLERKLILNSCQNGKNILKLTDFSVFCWQSCIIMQQN